MTKIVVDESLRNKLHNLSQPLELCDNSGRVLGRFTPVTGPFGANHLPPPLSEEELSRREQEPDYSTAEVLARLEKL